jgi:hypothetical protein
MIKESIKRLLRPVIWSIKKTTGILRANITEPTGDLPLYNGSNNYTFVVAVGPSFDQNRPDAMMTYRMGYCNAFEQLGIPYIIVDVNDLNMILPTLTNPLCMLFAMDYKIMSRRTIQTIKRYPKFVWVYPWFNKSKEFFNAHGLDARIWTLPIGLCKKILDSEPSFVFTATVEAGLHFFEKWSKHGQQLVSLPLGCDTALYNRGALYRKEFEGVQIAFVGGYWESKGKQIDKYLRPFEEDLIIYGYNKWPYQGYRGLLPRESEPSLYRQAKVSPTINEPTVKLLRGQINERVFKILGSGGMTIVDAVPSYRELFTEEELIIPKDVNEFYSVLRELLTNDSLRCQFSQRGYEAVIARHTYIHRARQILQKIGITIK